MDKSLKQWNGALANSLMLVYDEFNVNMYSDKEYYNFLKDLITSPRVSIKEKYVSGVELDSYHRLVFTTNDAQAIKLPNDDRRFVIIRTTNHWHDNLEHFQELKELLKSNSARAGFKHWMMSRQITHNVSIAPMTQAKEELMHSQSRVLDELITWANGDGLPMFFREILLPEDSRRFGLEPILVSRRLMREYFEKHNMRSYYDNTAIKELKVVLPTEKDHIKKRCITIVRGAMKEDYDLAFTIPPLAELRKNLEAATKHKIKWNEALVETPVDVDKTNVIELAKKDVL
jgi:hypothetical protein